MGAKAALKTASRQREQQTRDSEKGETAAPKGLESLAPQPIIFSKGDFGYLYFKY